MGSRARIAVVALALVVAAVAIVVAAVRLAGRPPSEGKRVAFGISGEQPADLRDARLRELGLRRARVQVSFDLYAPGTGSLPGLAAERTRLDAWLRAARAAGIEEVLVAFKAERDRPKLVPDPARYRRSVEATLRHIDEAGFGGMVNRISPWNEPDFSRTVTPEQAGRFYREVEQVCRARGCTALAGDFSDGHWTPAFQHRYQQAAGEPENWAWHAYGPDRRRLNRFLSMIPAGSRVEFTEQGGIVHRPGAPPQREAGAARQLERQIALARATPQVTAFYVYQWRGERSPRWDSGLVSPSGRERDSYCVFARAAGAQTARCAEAQPFR